MVTRILWLYLDTCILVNIICFNHMCLLEIVLVILIMCYCDNKEKTSLRVLVVLLYKRNRKKEKAFYCQAHEPPITNRSKTESQPNRPVVNSVRYGLQTTHMPIFAIHLIWVCLSCTYLFTYSWHDIWKLSLYK